MSELSGSFFEGLTNTVRKKRTLRSRPTETQYKSLSPFDETTKPSCDNSKGPTKIKISQRGPSNFVRIEDKMPNKKPVQDGSHYAPSDNKTIQNGMISHGSNQTVPGISNSKEPTNGFMLKSMNCDEHRVNGGARPINGHLGTGVGGIESQNKVKRVKFKVDSMKHTMHASSAPNDEFNGYVARDHPSIEGIHVDQKGTPWKDFPRGEFSEGRADSSMGRPAKSNPSKKVEKSEPIRKSRRAPNRRVLDLELEDDEVDDEIRFLKKLRNIKSSPGHNEDEDDEESSRKRQKYSRVSEISMATGKCREMSENMENEHGHATPPKSKEGDILADPKRSTTLTARQRALQSGRGGPSSPDGNLEFPNGLQSAPLKKKKEDLSEKELLKKAEAAQRRRLQNEIAAQKSQEDAIRKILSQDSSKKKKEDQRRKRMEELAEEKAAEAIKHQSETVRVVMAPTGTTVLFGENCIPSLFTTKPPSYPPPRERCAGPFCTNPYKYRDSKSKLPLCSLKCYKAVREEERLDTESSC
ncbi:hypothetical protein QQ045_025808 [Rhodiola kirilowii]